MISYLNVSPPRSFISLIGVLCGMAATAAFPHASGYVRNKVLQNLGSGKYNSSQATPRDY